METINNFKKTLLDNGGSASKATVKNYVADVKKFVLWFETTYQRQFPPSAISKGVIEAYMAEFKASSPRSAKRYRSSLNKFFNYMVGVNKLPYNPLSASQEDNKNKDEWHLKEFKSFLYVSNASPVTIKSYLNDITQFLSWVKEVIPASVKIPGISSHKDVFAKIDSHLIEEYKERLLNGAGLSPLSINRKLSSLRKFINWADQKGYLKNKTEVAESIFQPKEAARINNNPLETAGIASTDPLDALKMLNDIESSVIDEASSLPLQNEDSQSYSRIAPIRLAQKSKKGINFLFDTLVILSILKTVEAVKYNLWKKTGKEVFAPLPSVINSISQAESSVRSQISQQPISTFERFIKMGQRSPIGRIKSIPKAQYAPYKISAQALPLPQKIKFYAKHVRPKWYKAYHSYSFVHYLHFGIVIIFAVFLGYKIYQTYTGTGFQQAAFASPKTSPTRLLSFKGRLTDSSGTPITRESPVRLAIYKSPTASGSALLWQETQTIQPDAEGNFQTMIGKSNPVSQELFVNNPDLYLGISVGASPELMPRHALANLGLSRNAQLLQGLRPITENNSLTANVILALDSSGNLTIGGNASPIFQATGGEFTFSGQQLTLTTNLGTNSNIVLEPDGTGIIDVRKPLRNTSDNNNASEALGAVEINDNLAILATSSAQAALIIKQNDTGDLISAHTGDSAKFTVANNGAGMFASDLKILGNNLTTATNTFNIANENSTVLNIGGMASLISFGANTGTTTINNSLAVNSTIIAKGGIVLSSGKSLTLTDFLAGSIPFINSSNQLVQDNASFFFDAANKKLGLGTNSPGSRLTVFDNISGAGKASATITNANTLDSFDTTSLRLNLGTAPSGTKSRFIAFYTGCTTSTCIGSEVGRIRLSNNSVSYESTGADFAERFPVSEATEPGDIIGTTTTNNRKARTGDTILGVVSDSAVVVGNSPKDVNEAENPIVGLLGQVRTKVSTINGSIKRGDLITLSENSGIGQKSTGSGPVLGTALEDLSSEEAVKTARILVLVRPGWYTNKAMLMDNGSLATAYETNKANEEINGTKETNTNTTSGSSVSSGSFTTSADEFIDTVKAGYIHVQDLTVAGALEAKKITTESLSIATEDIMIGTQTLREYIAAIVHEIVDQRLAQQDKKTITVVTPLADASIDVSPTPTVQPANSPTPTPPSDEKEASQSATYITNIYNNASPSQIGSPSAKTESDSAASPSATPTPTTDPSVSPSPVPDASKSAVLEPTPTPSLTVDPDATSSSTPNMTDYSLIQMLRKQIKNTKAANIASFSAELAYVPNLKSDFATFDYGLIALGPTSLAETSISSSLSIGQNMTLSDNSINTLTGDLNLQPLKQGSLTIMGGLVAIDTQGNLTVEGNATFAKDVTVRGSLAAGIISPLAGSNEINLSGNVASSGSARFAHFEADSFRVVRGVQADTSFTHTVASASAGSAVITANETERTIITPFVNKDSLIYITPASDTQGVTPYIARQTIHDNATGSRGSFTIQIPRFVSKDIKMNWWIIN
jgi:site-specific recombinase XerD